MTARPSRRLLALTVPCVAGAVGAAEVEVISKGWHSMVIQQGRASVISLGMEVLDKPGEDIRPPACRDPRLAGRSVCVSPLRTAIAAADGDTHGTGGGSDAGRRVQHKHQRFRHVDGPSVRAPRLYDAQDWLRAGTTDSGFVLGPIMERSFRQSLLISNGDPTIFFTRPISGTLIGIAALIVALSAFQVFRKRSRERAGDTEA